MSVASAALKPSAPKQSGLSRSVRATFPDASVFTRVGENHARHNFFDMNARFKEPTYSAP